MTRLLTVLVSCCGLAGILGGCGDSADGSGTSTSGGDGADSSNDNSTDSSGGSSMGGAETGETGEGTSDGGHASGESSGSSGADTIGGDAPPAQAPLMGHWTGVAVLDGHQLLPSGEREVVVRVAQFEDRIIGTLDVHIGGDAYFGDWVGYNFEGSVESDTLSLQLTERICGAVEPEGLCWPVPNAMAFTAAGLIDGDGTMEWSDVVPIEGVTYPDGIPIEAPFVTLTLTHESQPPTKDTGPVVGRWTGDNLALQTHIVAGSGPLWGENVMAITADGDSILLDSFDNEGSNIYPTWDDIILPDTFRYSAATGRFWFVQTWTQWGNYIHLGKVIGERMTGVVIADDFDAPVYEEGVDPKDLDAFSATNLITVFDYRIEAE